MRPVDASVLWWFSGSSLNKAMHHYSKITAHLSFKCRHLGGNLVQISKENPIPCKTEFLEMGFILHCLDFELGVVPFSEGSCGGVSHCKWIVFGPLWA